MGTRIACSPKHTFNNYRLLRYVDLSSSPRPMERAYGVLYCLLFLSKTQYFILTCRSFQIRHYKIFLQKEIEILLDGFVLRTTPFFLEDMAASTLLPAFQERIILYICRTIENRPFPINFLSINQNAGSRFILL